MRILILTAAAVLSLGRPVFAQTSLAECIPADTLAYIRIEDPIGAWEKITGSGEIWTQPTKVSSKTRASMDKNLKSGDRNLGKEEGTLDAWLRSIGTIELALFSLDFGGKIEEMDGPPMPDFVASLESPAAIEMYNTMSQMMVDRGRATRNERGDLVITMPGAGGFAPLFSVQGSRIILASSEGRLNSAVAASKGGTGNSLASNPAFQATVGDGRGPNVAYMRFGALLQLIRDNLSDENQRRMTDIITPLGLTKITAIGYREDGPNGVITAKSDGPINAFQLLKGKTAPPTLQGLLPVDTAFAITHTNDFGEHVKRIQKYLTDPKTFPFAPAVGAGLVAMSMKLGLTLDGAVSPFTDGFVVAAIPDESGKLYEEESMVVVARMPEKEAADAFLAKLKKTVASSAGLDVAESVEGAVTWFTTSRKQAASGDESQASSRSSRFRSRRDTKPPIGAFVNQTLVVGGEAQVKKVVASITSKGPNLTTTGAFKRLPQDATFYVTGSLKSIFSNENSFATALSFLKDFGAFGSSITATDDTVVVTSNRAPGQFMSIMMTGGMMHESSAGQRREVIAKLDEIGQKTRAFYEKNKKWPASLADLGYAPDKMPSAVDSEGKTFPIVFLPPKPETPAEGGYKDLLAYWQSNEFGRLCVNTMGTSWSWSESDFLSALQRYNTMK